MKKKISILNNRSVIKILGKDNHLFLNNIISNDLNKINNKEILLNTLLSPQGKILFDFFIFKNKENYFIECSKNQLNDLIKKLKLYSLRLEVNVEEEKFNVIASNFFTDNEIVRKDSRFQTEIVYRSFSKQNDKIVNYDTSEWYNHLRFLEICPEGELEIPSNKIYPFEINMIYENGINFDKGCFIGQEVVARVKYRGSVKKKYASLKIDASKVIDNTNIFDNSKKAAGSLIYNSKVYNDILGFGLIKTKYIQKKLTLFCKNFQVNILD